MTGTVLFRTAGPIYGFAQDGEVAAYAAGAEACGKDGKNRAVAVRIRRLSTGRDERVNGRCATYGYDIGLFAGAGRRVTWVTTHCGITCFQYVALASSGRRKARTVLESAYDDPDGPRIVEAAGDDSAFVYAIVSEDWIPSNCRAEGPWGPCVYGVVGGEIMRLPAGGRRPTRLRSSPPAKLIAVSGGRVAAVVAETPGCACNSGASWSSDGQRIAFASQRDGFVSALYSVRADGSDVQQLTRLKGVPLSDAQWSPDGSQLLFTAGYNGPEVVVASADGSRQRRLFQGSQATWSPDGTRIAFTSRSGEIYVANRDGSDEQLITEGANPDWSPDGKRLLFEESFASPEELHVIGVDGKNERVVARGESPDWSPDGARIAFQRFERGDDELYVAAVDGRGQRRLTNNKARDAAPAWSPDGRSIAFERGTEPTPVRPSRSEIYLIDVDGGNARRVTSTSSPPPRSLIQIHRLSRGTLVTRFETASEASDIALSRSHVALLARRGRAKSLHLHEAGTGRLTQAIGVPSAAAEITIGTNQVVFRVGSAIYAVDVRTRRRTRVAIAHGKPIGLSIEGRRVAWAENAGGRGRVRAVVLSR